MKIKHLLAKLETYDPELDVGVVATTNPDCNCLENGHRCYCRDVETEKDILGMREERPQGKLSPTKIWLDIGHVG